VWSGLCIPHLIKTIGIASSKLQKQDFASISEILLQLQIKAFKRIGFELAEFIRKHDPRFAREGFGSEKDAVERAAIKLAGIPHPGPITVKVRRVRGKRGKV